MNNFSFLGKNILGCDADFKTARTVVIGAPFDGTVTYRPGSRFAPAAIRGEMNGIETYSPYQDVDLCDFSVHDMGDLDLPFGNTDAALDMIQEAFACLFKNNKKPFMIGGEHLVTLPALKAALKKYPDLHVIHLDAHADLREDYISQTHSHSTVMRRIWDLLGNGHIWQFGIRSGTKEEFTFAKEGHTFFYPFTLDSIDLACDALKNKNVYLTIDLDVLDSSAFPGTGTPEAGGVTFQELLNSLLKLKGLNIIGVDMVELSPHYDASGSSTALACKLLRELLILISE